MVKSTDFTPQEWQILCKAPVMVASNSMMIGPADMLKAMKIMFTLILLMDETSKQFPENECIQEIMMTLRRSGHHTEGIRVDERDRKQTLGGEPRRGKESAIPERNGWSEKAITILRQKNHPQELKEYKQWLLLIASGVMEKVKSYGFLGLRKKAAEVELAQTILDFAQVLQLAE